MGKSTSRRPSGHPDPPEYWTTKDAERAVARIKEAATAAGIKLPSVDRQYYSLDCPLIELGRVNAPTAFALADAFDELAALRAEVAELRGKKEELSHG